MKENIGKRGPMPTSTIGGVGTQLGNGIVEVGVGAGQAGPGMTAIAYIKKMCKKCQDCEGDCDDDGSCEKACKICEEAKEKMQGPIGRL
jgi:hypothetical protein